MPVRTSSSDSLENPPPKHRRIDDPEILGPLTDDPTLVSDPVRVRRQALPGRATISNAADSIYFSKNRALVYDFVDMYDVVLDELGKLQSCTLRCGICRKGVGWKWQRGGKSRGSTSNPILHMKTKHAPIWDNACYIDKLGPAGPTEQAKTEPTASDEQSQATSNNSQAPFNIDELYRRLTRWIVTGHQPFTEVENEEFQDVLTYLKPALEGHLLKSEAIRDRIIGHAGVMRHSMKQYLTSLPGLMAIACDGWTSSN
ncbi:hypothetical protein FRC12_018580 [Ceratobasidium sp. 428]|nr:hypothetical protein FRC12_018580 [Ceratobasidium sp. 428]